MSKLKHIVKGLTHTFTALAGAILSGGITLANGQAKRQRNQAFNHLNRGLHSTPTTAQAQQQVAEAVANNRARGVTQENQAVTRFREANAKIKNKTHLGGQ